MKSHQPLTTTALAGASILAMAIAANGLLAAPVRAQTTTWTGTSGDWFDPAQWDNAAPGTGVDAVIGEGAQVGVGTSGAEAANVRVGGSTGANLTIAGGHLTSDVNTVGGSGVGHALVDGAGSEWTTSIMLVGGTSLSTLTVSNGGTVRGGYMYLATDSGTVGAVTVTGFGSQWLNAGTTVIGGSGEATLTLSDGAALESLAVQIAGNTSGRATILVTGNGTLWDTSNFSAGDNGEVTMTIADGARIDSDISTIANGAGTAAVTVTGTNSTWASNYALTVAGYGTGTLTIEAGGVVTNAAGHVGLNAGSSGTVTVTGTNSRWTNSALLTVGAHGNGTLTVSNGGTVQSQGGTIGAEVGSTGTATVTGANSSWASSDSFRIGQNGTGTLTIANGGSASGVSGLVGQAAGSSGTVTVTGADSEWILQASLQVGESGTGSLTIADGGLVTNGNGNIGVATSGVGRVLVTGVGSKWLLQPSWAINKNVYVGVQGRGELTIADGGLVESDNGDIGYFGTGRGDLLVTGANSTWTVAGGLVVGNAGQGTARIEAGGTITSQDGDLGLNNNATGSMTVTGSGSAWLVAQDLNIGNVGTGALTIADNALVTALGTRLGVSGGDGTLRLETGGTLQTGALGSGGDGRITFDGGKLRITASQGDLFNGFATGDVELAAGGGTIDTQNYNAFVEIGLFGAGGFTKAGSGWMVLDAANTYLGTTTVADGQLYAGSANVFSDVSTHDLASGTELGLAGYNQTIGGLSGTGNVTLDGATLSVGKNNTSTTFGGEITGSSGIVKIGTGTLTLTGDQSYGGPTVINAGKLVVNGDLTSAILVNAGGLLGGSGTMSNVVIGSGASLTPGNSIGTANFSTLTLNSGANYEVELKGGGNVAGTHNDLALVSGVATIDTGTTIEVKPENGTDTGRTYTANTTYTVIRAGTLVVNATPTISDTFAFLDFAGSFDLGLGEFYLTSSAVATTFCLPGATFNQCSTGDGVYALGAGHTAFDALLGMTEAEANAALDALSGEVHASGQQVIDATFALFGDTLRAGAGRRSVAPAAVPALGYVSAPASTAGMAAIDEATLAGMSQNAWFSPLAMRGVVASDGNAGALDFWSAGLAAGYEHSTAFADGTVSLGFGLGYLQGRGTVAARQSSLDTAGLHLGAYGAWSEGPWSLDGSLAYAANSVSTQRRIVFPGTDQTATASYWTQALGLSAEAAYAVALTDSTTLSPLATLDAGWAGHGGFTETGAGAFNLSGAAESRLSLNLGLGLALEHVVELESGTVTFEGRAVWEHGFADPVPTQNLAFATSPSTFEIRGPLADRDRLNLGLGVRFEPAEGVTLRANYGGSFSANQQSHAASAGLTVKF